VASSRRRAERERVHQGRLTEGPDVSRCTVCSRAVPSTWVMAGSMVEVVLGPLGQQVERERPKRLSELIWKDRRQVSDAVARA